MKTYHVYIMTNWNNKVMYIGVTSDLAKRVYEHKHKLLKGFTEKYNINKLVYLEETNDIDEAILREKQIKKWRRNKKNRLVSEQNPHWVDLSESRDVHFTQLFRQLVSHSDTAAKPHPD